MAETKSKPILMSGAMVRAIIEGRKTQTRRVVADANSQGNWKPSECDLSSAFVDPGPSPAGNPGPYLKALVTSEALKAHGWSEDDEIRDRIYPRIFPGDEMWVRETWNGTQGEGVAYRATEPHMDGEPWRQSIHMPRWASRLTLTVKDVRVERLQDISEEDAKAEGIDFDDEHGFHFMGQDFATGRSCYAALWSEINGAGSWDANPWVWVYSFSVNAEVPRG